MKKSRTTVFVSSGLLILAALALVSCDPAQLVQSYFKQLGLNQLAIVRDDIQPGALIDVKGKDAIYDDNMLEYVTDPNGTDVTVTAVNKLDDYNAVLRQYKGSRSIDASVALSFIKTILPIDPSANLNISGSVTIDMTNVKAQRMSPASITKFLNGSVSKPFRDHLQQLNSSVKPYLVYEIETTNKLSITTSSSSNIGATVKVGEIQPLGSANGSFTYKRTGDTTLEIDGDHYYVFAIRVGQLVYKNNTYALDITNYTLPGSWGVKAAGTDEKYSAPLVGEYEPVKLVSRSALE
jgi:hypothetical protein